MSGGSWVQSSARPAAGSTSAGAPAATVKPTVTPSWWSRTSHVRATSSSVSWVARTATRIVTASASQTTDATRTPSGPLVAASTAASASANETGESSADSSRSASSSTPPLRPAQPRIRPPALS